MTLQHIFIMSDHEIFLKSLRAQISGHEEAIRTELIKADKEGSGSVSGEALEAALEAAGLKFTRHQAICLRRRLDREKTGTLSIEEFLSVLGISK
jgi:Ca2+-binding EF-hand superfamily protein